MSVYLSSRARRGCKAALFAFTALAGLSSPAHAQRAGEDAISAADDAFGTRVGNESLGLYDTNNARGFSPVTAGNVRIEGLYFDQSPQLNERLIRGSNVRVGISAQSYPFRAPTGVADYRLRLPGDETVVSTVAVLGPYATKAIEFDAQVAVTPEFSVGFGLGFQRLEDDFTNMSDSYTGAILARWRPGDTDTTAFYSRTEDCKTQQQPQTLTAGNYEPPRPQQRTNFGQDWHAGDCTDENAGVISRVSLPGDWSIRAGAFRSWRVVNKMYGEIFTNVDTAGIGTRSVYKQPPLGSRSYSGEVRIAKTFAEGPRRHTFDVALRGRDVRRDYGGSNTVALGRFPIFTPNVMPEPVFNLGATGDDHSSQGTVGLSYDALWAGVGGFSVDVQKTFYHREQAPAVGRIAKTNATPILYSVAGNYLVTRSLALYASYTRGFEETGAAAMSAANRGEAQPVSFTRQADAGFRYNITPTMTAVAGVFQVEKPYFNVNAANIYGPFGDVRHRGIEFSLTGQPIPGLRMLGGFVLIDPRISGDAVDQGLIGPVSVSIKTRSVLLSLNYQPKEWRGFGIEGTAQHTGPMFAHPDNMLKLKDNTLFNVGARYNFNVKGVPASIRVQALNVTDVFTWNVTYTGNFLQRPPRRYVVTLAADF